MISSLVTKTAFLPSRQSILDIQNRSFFHNGHIRRPLPLSSGESTVLRIAYDKTPRPQCVRARIQPTQYTINLDRLPCNGALRGKMRFGHRGLPRNGNPPHCLYSHGYFIEHSFTAQVLLSPTGRRRCRLGGFTAAPRPYPVAHMLPRGRPRKAQHPQQRAGGGQDDGGR